MKGTPFVFGTRSQPIDSMKADVILGHVGEGALSERATVLKDY